MFDGFKLGVWTFSGSAYLDAAVEGKLLLQLYIKRVVQIYFGFLHIVGFVILSVRSRFHPMELNPHAYS